MSSESQDTRTRILDATARMLAAQGAGARMGDIAKGAGISRQALYLHFASRTELLVATTRHVDERLDLEARLAPSRAAQAGRERLARYIAFWGGYIPDIYGVGKALMMASETDAAAAAAWRDRMAAMRDGCLSAVEALRDDGDLAPGWDVNTATDALWTLLLVPNWEQLVRVCGWTHDDYVARMQAMAARMLVRDGDG